MTASQDLHFHISHERGEETLQHVSKEEATENADISQYDRYGYPETCSSEQPTKALCINHVIDNDGAVTGDEEISDAKAY